MQQIFGFVFFFFFFFALFMPLDMCGVFGCFDCICICFLQHNHASFCCTNACMFFFFFCIFILICYHLLKIILLLLLCSFNFFMFLFCVCVYVCVCVSIYCCFIYFETFLTLHECFCYSFLNSACLHVLFFHLPCVLLVVLFEVVACF